MNFTFNAEVARLFMAHEAVFFYTSFILVDTKTKQIIKNFHEVEIETETGEKTTIKAYWEYNSMREFAEVFPFWTQRHK
ncbi:MAG: hypothetical protein RUMPE_00941 [Eubacteriales bacterium SKADARSKE-1]|nr:hypothetical protein [Eubacteriales bacterium SKADARSKE-1]